MSDAMPDPGKLLTWLFALAAHVQWWRDHCIGTVDSTGDVIDWRDIQEQNRVLRLRIQELESEVTKCSA